MRPEAEAQLRTAKLCLAKASDELAAAAAAPLIAESAARDAYYSAFHAAQALIVERTGREPKTHTGVHREFHRLTRNQPEVPQSLRSFLTSAYDFKTLADYSTAPPPRVSIERATTAVEMAREFLAAVTTLLPA